MQTVWEENIIYKKIIVTIVALLSLFNIALSENIPGTPADDKRWKFLVFSNDFTLVFLDTDSYTSYVSQNEFRHNRCRIANVWEWHTLGKNNPTNALYTICNIIYDFNCKTIQVKRIVEYNKNNSCIDDFTFNDAPVQVVPGSFGEALLKGVIDYDNQKNI